MIPRFRVWDEKHRRMHEPPHAFVIDGTGKVMGYQRPNGFPQVWDMVDQQKVETMLSTGLTDVEGNEIFESDILVVPNDSMKDLGVVTTAKEGVPAFLLVCDWLSYKKVISQRVVGEDNLEIVGNVYEDPYLLDELKESKRWPPI